MVAKNGYRRYLNQEDLHAAIEILKENNPTLPQMPYPRIAHLVEINFDCYCGVKQVMEYYKAPIEEKFIGSEIYDYYGF